MRWMAPQFGLEKKIDLKRGMFGGHADALQDQLCNLSSVSILERNNHNHIRNYVDH